MANMHGNEVSCAKDLSAFETLNFKNKNLPEDTRFLSNMNYQISNTLFGQIASPTYRSLGGSCCCTWPSTSAPPTWLETRSTIFVHFGTPRPVKLHHQVKSTFAPPTWLETKLTIFVHFSILVHHGINWACKSRPPSSEHLCISYLTGD